MGMKWLTNLYDPQKDDAKLHIVHSPHETQEQAWQRELEYLRGKIVGEPKATANCSVIELKAMGMVGIYECPVSLEVEE